MDVRDPFRAFDRYDERSRAENNLFKELKQNWHFEHRPKKTNKDNGVSTLGNIVIMFFIEPLAAFGLLLKNFYGMASLSAYAEDHGPWPWMNARRITLRSLVRPSSAVACYGGWKGGYASADSAEEQGGTTGFARGAPWKRDPKGRKEQSRIP